MNFEDEMMKARMSWWLPSYRLALANTISKLISEAVIMKMLMLVVMLARNG